MHWGLGFGNISSPSTDAITLDVTSGDAILQLYVNPLASLSLSDGVSAHLPSKLNFYLKMMSWLFTIRSQDVFINIINHHIINEWAIVNNDRLYRDGQLAVLRQTAASLCHFLSDISDQTVTRSCPVMGNLSNVATQSFHCLCKKMDDFAQWCF